MFGFSKKERINESILVVMKVIEAQPGAELKAAAVEALIRLIKQL